MELLVILIPVLLMAVLCGTAANLNAKMFLKPYKENLYAKFKSGFLSGLLTTFMNGFYWIGNCIAIIVVFHFSDGISWVLLLLWDIFWYTLVFTIVRMVVDRVFGASPPYPTIELNNPLIQEGVAAVYRELEINLNAPLGRLKRRWAMPSGKYAAAYLWDSAFIALAWKDWDIRVASEILLPLLDKQAKDGRVPHFASPINNSSKTQPPLIAWSITHLDVDKEYLMAAYNKLKKYNQWLYENRRLKNGLFFWEHSYESGIDNSPRFTDRSEKVKYDLTARAVIDLNSFMVLQNNSLIKIAIKLKKHTEEGDFQQDIKEFEKKNETLVGLIQKYLWDEEAGLYFDYNIERNKRIEINTIASFFPLIAGVPTEAQAGRLIEHLKGEREYNTLIPLPTVALNDSNFEKDTWRGPMWVNTAYLVIKGLEQYNEQQLSSDFALRVVQGVFKTWKSEGSFYEFYDPERFDLVELTRKKGNLWKQITLGGKPVKHFVGWTGLVNTLIIESIIGFDLIEKSIRPRLPDEMRGTTLTIKFPQRALEMKITYKNMENISIHLTDLAGIKPDLVKKCALYQKVSLAEFFTEE